MVFNQLGDNYHQLGQIQAEIESEKQRLVENRRAERAITAKEKAFQEGRLTSGAQGNVQSFYSHLKKFLPPQLFPGNLGPAHGVQWPFHQVWNFDFGLNPTLTAATRSTQGFQVTQEAGFLIMALSWQPTSYTTSGYLGPWFLEIRDRQSSRQFNDNPVPLQTIGSNSNPTVLPVPMFILPNAFLDATITARLPAGAASQSTTGSGQHQIMVFGYKTREKDINKLLSTIYG